MKCYAWSSSKNAVPTVLVGTKNVCSSNCAAIARRLNLFPLLLLQLARLLPLLRLAKLPGALRRLRSSPLAARLQRLADPLLARLALIMLAASLAVHVWGCFFYLSAAAQTGRTTWLTAAGQRPRRSLTPSGLVAWKTALYYAVARAIVV